MNKDYLSEKQKIFKNAEIRAKKIIEKYKIENGYLDGEPWKNELKKDSTKVLEELKKLEEKYKIKI